MRWFQKPIKEIKLRILEWLLIYKIVHGWNKIITYENWKIEIKKLLLLSRLVLAPSAICQPIVKQYRQKDPDE